MAEILYFKAEINAHEHTYYRKQKIRCALQREYNDLRTKAVSKAIPAKKFSLKDGKKLAHKLVDEWAKGK